MPLSCGNFLADELRLAAKQWPTNNISGDQMTADNTNWHFGTAVIPITCLDAADQENDQDLVKKSQTQPKKSRPPVELRLS